MGIRWLTSYVAGIERSISSDVTFPIAHGDGQGGSSSSSSNAKTYTATFVIDAWAFIFRVWLNKFGDAVRGLDLQAYKDMVGAIVDAWTRAGIQCIFVFDGPMLPAKLPKIVERRASIAASTQAFIKSSAESRASRRFQRECGIISPFLSFATIDALRQAGAVTRTAISIDDFTSGKANNAVELIFAPTEADSLVAEVAASKPNGYAVSQDSDYFVLCARGQGCAGYVPLENIDYLVESNLAKTSQIDEAQRQAGSAAQSIHDTDAALAAALARGEIDDTPTLNDGFEEVSSRKRGRRRQPQASSAQPGSAKNSAATQTAMQFPPSSAESDTIGKVSGVRIRAYRSHDLATHLQLTPTLLPLLAAIIGNDYSTPLQNQIMLRHITGPPRVTRAATLLREEWIRVKSGAGARMGKREQSRTPSVRRGNGRGPMMAGSPHLGEDDAKSDVGSSATATPTARTPGAMQSLSMSSPHDPVRALVEAVVDRALAETLDHSSISSYISSGERANIVDSVIDGAATYSLLTQSNAPHLASPSALFFGEGMSLLAAHGSINGNGCLAHPKLIDRYRAAYEAGRFNAVLVETMAQRIFLSALMPEQTDVASVHATTAKHLRAWIYAVLFEAWGLSWAREQWAEPEPSESQVGSEDESDTSRGPIRFGPDKSYREGEQPDDVISVHTESSESEQDFDDEEKGHDDVAGRDELPSRPGSVNDFRQTDAEQIKPAPAVHEYYRAGSLYNCHLVRIHSLSTLLRFGTDLEPDFEPSSEVNGDAHKDLQSILPPSLSSVLAQHEAAEQEGKIDVLTPAALLPQATRLDLFFHAHEAKPAIVKLLPRECWMIVATLRALVSQGAKSLRIRGRMRDNWSRSEIIVAIESALHAKEKGSGAKRDVAHSDAMSTVLPSARAIHLGSTLQLVAQTSAYLAQALLLTTDSEDGEAEKDAAIETFAHPEHTFDGPTFYCGMSKIHDAIEGEDDAPRMLSKTVAGAVEAVVQGHEDALGIDALDLKRERKAKKRAAREQKMAQSEETSSAPAGANPATRRAGGKSLAAKNAFALLEENA